MKYLKQLLLIFAVAFVGEVLNHLIPLPIPASIYGIIILFLLLVFHIIPLDAVKGTGDFLVSMMQVFLIPAVVGLLDIWDIIRPSLFAYAVIILVSTFVVMGISGKVTQTLIRKEDLFRLGEKHD